MANNFPTAVPTSFVANTKAKSAEVNANFAKIVEWITSGNYDLYTGSLFLKSVAKSADYTVLDNDGYATIFVTTGATNRTITLPAAANNVNRTLRIKKVDSGTGYVTIDGNGTETIDGALTMKLFLQYDSVTLLCDGTTWYIADFRYNGKWQSYTPVIVSANADATEGTSTKKCAWRRIPAGMQIHYEHKQTVAGTSGTGTYLFPIPTGYTIDTTYITASSSGLNESTCGNCGVRQGSSFLFGNVDVHNTTKLILSVADSAALLSLITGSNIGFGSNATIYYNFTAVVPITEFA